MLFRAAGLFGGYLSPDEVLYTVLSALNHSNLATLLFPTLAKTFVSSAYIWHKLFTVLGKSLMKKDTPLSNTTSYRRPVTQTHTHPPFGVCQLSMMSLIHAIDLIPWDFNLRSRLNVRCWTGIKFEVKRCERNSFLLLLLCSLNEGDHHLKTRPSEERCRSCFHRTRPATAGSPGRPSLAGIV